MIESEGHKFQSLPNEDVCHEVDMKVDTFLRMSQVKGGKLQII